MRYEMTAAVAPQEQTMRLDHDEVAARSMLVITMRRLRRSQRENKGFWRAVSPPNLPDLGKPAYWLKSVLFKLARTTLRMSLLPAYMP